MTEKQRHDWNPDVRGGSPVLRCDNRPCRIVWWPDRLEPRSECRGNRGEHNAAELVKAIMAGGL